jgi:beta-galactosidase
MIKRFGICYYPELYRESDRARFMDEDIALMTRAGFNVVRMAEFTWCLMEPSEGVYDFRWLDRIVEKLGENGIVSILGTPTAAPPVWMAEKYPEIRYVDNHGVQRSYGGRHYSCRSNALYREFTRKICREMGRRYGNSPYVLGFQVDNELAQEHSGRCHCPACAERFWGYLREKYGTIGNLNEKLGTLFWGQIYDSFEQVMMPVCSEPKTAESNLGWYGADNPALRLEYERFSSDALVNYYELQRKTLAEYTDKPITHNTTHLGTNDVDIYKLFRNSAVAAVDHYPPARETDNTQSSVIYSMTRNVLKKDFWLLETLCGGGQGNWVYQGMPQGFPDTFRQNIAYTYVSGAEIITAFKYMVFPAGFEQLGSALLDLDRVPRRRFQEFCEAAEDMKKYGPVLEKTEIRADVAIILSYDSLWSSRIKPINKAFAYEAYIQELYGALMKLGINVDIIPESADLHPYKLVILPFGTVVSEEFKNAVRNYVECGGHFTATCLSFSKDYRGNGVVGESMPLGLIDVFGARVAEVEPVFPETVSRVSTVGGTYTTKYWQESLELLGAGMEAVYADTFRKGEPVFSANRYGKGEAIYMGASLEPSDMTAYFGSLCSRYNIPRAPVIFGDGVDVVTRTGEGGPCYFVFNSGPEEAKVVLSGQFHNRMTNQLCRGETVIGPKRFLVLEQGT